MTAPTQTPARTEGRMKFLHYVFTTVLEGGISYWAQCETYHWRNENRRPESTVMDADYSDLTGFYAMISPADETWGIRPGRDDEHLRIDIDVIERGVNLLIDGIIAAHKSGDPKAPFSSEYLRNFVIQWMTDGEDGDSDADVCDVVVQLGLFGELVYS